MYKVYIKENYLFIEDDITPDINKMNVRHNVYIERDGLIFNFYRVARDFPFKTLHFSDIVNEGGKPYADIDNFIDFVVKKTGSQLNFTNGSANVTNTDQSYSGGGLDVSVQDQHTPIILAKLSKIENETTLSAVTAINDLTITITDPTGFVTGKYLSIFDIISNRFYLAYITGVVGSIITLDTPLDFAYPIGSFVTSAISNMSVDGSVTPVIFGLRNTTETIGITADITRIMFHCHTDASVDLGKFGDIAGGLLNGIVLRKVDGTTRDIFNVKTNGEMAAIMFDFDILDAQNAVQGQNGFNGRLTFAGQSKVGVTIRLAPGEDLQLLVRDDLTQIDLLEITAEGHEVLISESLIPPAQMEIISITNMI